MPSDPIRLADTSAWQAKANMDPQLLSGSVRWPTRALALVREWATMHRDELRKDWMLARTGRVPGAIAPLE